MLSPNLLKSQISYSVYVCVCGGGERGGGRGPNFPLESKSAKIPFASRFAEFFFADKKCAIPSVFYRLQMVSSMRWN